MQLTFHVWLCVKQRTKTHGRSAAVRWLLFVSVSATRSCWIWLTADQLQLSSKMEDASGGNADVERLRMCWWIVWGHMKQLRNTPNLRVMFSSSHQANTVLFTASYRCVNVSFMDDTSSHAALRCMCWLYMCVIGVFWEAASCRWVTISHDVKATFFSCELSYRDSLFLALRYTF